MDVLKSPGVRPGRLLPAAACFFRMMTQPRVRIANAQKFLCLMEGNSFERAFAAFGATPAGSALLSHLPDSLALLRDRDRLARTGEGALGRTYRDFMVAHDIDESLYLAGVVAAGKDWGEDRRRAWFRVRVEAAHDLRHLLTGYGIDVYGEICLLGFRFAQTRNPGVALLAIIGAVGLKARGRRGVLRSLAEAYRHGKRARLLDLLPWEVALDQPLAAIQADFGIARPEVYLSHGGDRDTVWQRAVRSLRIDPAEAPAR